MMTREARGLWRIEGIGKASSDSGKLADGLD